MGAGNGGKRMRKECVIVKLDQYMRGLFAGFLIRICEEMDGCWI